MKVKYSLKKLNTASNSYTVFLSHSNINDEWKTFVEELESNGIRVYSDQGIKPGALDFAVSIKEMICGSEIMLVLIENEKVSPWMVYEIGIAAGLGKKILLYSKTPVNTAANYLFGQYGPVINDMVTLIHEIKNSFFFVDLFDYETMKLHKSDFLNACMKNIDICRLSFSIPGIEEIPKSTYRFGYILLSVARYEKLVNENRLKDICNKTAEEIVDLQCNIDGNLCSLCSEQNFETPTDVILNKILYNCTVDLTKQRLDVTLPFNRLRGVTFKCFVDVRNMDYVQDVMLLLSKAGLYDIGVSHSAQGNRIYFMLPQSAMNGLFAVEAPDGFINNYLCKGAVL